MSHRHADCPAFLHTAGGTGINAQGLEKSHFGVSAVRWNDSRTEIIDLMLHTLSVDDDGGCTVVGGVSCPVAAVAELIAGGEVVWLVSRNERSGEYELESQLGFGGPHEELLFTVPTRPLLGLPTY